MNTQTIRKAIEKAYEDGYTQALADLENGSRHAESEKQYSSLDRGVAHAGHGKKGISELRASSTQ